METIQPAEMKTAIFEGFEIQMTLEQARSASHPGDCLADVEKLLADPAIAKQVEEIGVTKIRRELRQCGAWSDWELRNVPMLRRRIVWLAACDINEENPSHEAQPKSR